MSDAKPVKPVDLVDRDDGRLAARWSVILVFACFIATWLGGLFEVKWGPIGSTVGNTLGFTFLVGSVALAVVGILRGWRQRAWETVQIAVIGLTLSGSVLGVMIWFAAQVLSQSR